MQALKRKKRIEKQLQQLDGTISTVEFQREALENASTNTEVMNVMSVAARALKGVHKDMDVDKVHDLMDEVAEQHEVANEIGDAISRPVGMGADIDEDELNAELEELAQEEIDNQLIEIERPEMPEVPKHVPAAGLYSLYSLIRTYKSKNLKIASLKIKSRQITKGRNKNLLHILIISYSFTINLM